MSSTNRGGERRPLDAYYTPTELADALVRLLIEEGWISPDAPGRLLEPHAGEGAWIRALRLQLPGAHITANDIVDSVSRWRACGADACRQGDFLALQGRFDGVIGNPPFSDAERHVRHALSLTAPRGIVAFLLRLGFIESRERIPLWREHPAAAVYVLSERPSFTGGGTDQTAYGLFVWISGMRRPTEIKVVSWRANGRRG